MKIYFTPEALRDLETIGDWIATDNPRRAISFVEELVSSCSEILSYPEKYPLAPRYENEGLRKKVYRNYLIFYRIKLGQIEIIHVLHGSQDYEQFLG
jgi:toxin ParE1/3/4